ncbi:MAG: GNAT family N-acetyltransferase [Candidatus Eremiobacteraeota bacterium]|nr:GNAT family N-acetyltransferase [Candidatus Eremiobacteraeota bacterium]
MIRVRSARETDRNAILELISAMGGHDDVATHAEPLTVLKRALADPSTRVLVAESDSEVVGVTQVQARDVVVNDAREAWLGMLSISPAWQRRGVGRLLIDAARAEALQMGCETLVLESSDWRDGAHAFYRALGFSEKAPARRFIARLRD